MKLALVLSVLMVLATTQAHAANALVIRLAINSSSDDSKATGAGIYSQTQSTSNSTVSARGTGRLSGLSQAVPNHTAQTTEVNGVDNKSTVITRLSAISESSVLVSVQANEQSNAGIKADYSYSGEAKISGGTWSDYQAGKTVRLEASASLMKAMLSSSGTILGQVIVSTFSPVLQANGIGLTLADVRVKSKAAQTCFASKTSLHCELNGAVSEVGFVAKAL